MGPIFEKTLSRMIRGAFSSTSDTYIGSPSLPRSSRASSARSGSRDNLSSLSLDISNLYSQFIYSLSIYHVRELTRGCGRVNFDNDKLLNSTKYRCLSDIIPIPTAPPPRKKDGQYEPKVDDKFPNVMFRKVVELRLKKF